MGRRGFTLIEILVVVLLAGMVTTLALAPVVFTVRRVIETQADYSDAGALERALAFIGKGQPGQQPQYPQGAVVVDLGLDADLPF